MKGRPGGLVDGLVLDLEQYLCEMLFLKKAMKIECGDVAEKASVMLL